MKVCISAQAPDLSSAVDPRFGRAAFLIMVDTETKTAKTLKGATGAAHGAGIQAAQAVLNARPEALVTGRLGPKAFDVLSATGLPVYAASGMSVAEALDGLAARRLEAIGQAGPPGPEGGHRR